MFWRDFRLLVCGLRSPQGVFAIQSRCILFPGRRLLPIWRGGLVLGAEIGDELFEFLFDLPAKNHEGAGEALHIGRLRLLECKIGAQQAHLPQPKPVQMAG